MDLLLTELLVTLGRQPVATANIPLYQRLVGDPALDGAVADLGPLNEPNTEYMLSQKPDHILVADWQAASLEMLEKIAPVTAYPVFAGKTPAIEHVQQLLRLIATQTDRLTVAENNISDCERAIETASRALSGFDRPVYVCRFNRDGRNVAMFGGNGLIGDMLKRLNLRNAFEGRVNASGVTSVALNRLAENSDAVLIHFDRGVETDAALDRLAQNPIWNAFPAVRAGRIVRMPVIYPNGGVRSAERLAEQMCEGLSNV
jgi:iron complex transport system substrate-binding protein